MQYTDGEFRTSQFPMPQGLIETVSSALDYFQRTKRAGKCAAGAAEAFSKIDNWLFIRAFLFKYFPGA